MSIKPQDLRGMTEEEIQLKLESLHEEIFRLTYAAKSGNVEKPHRLQDVRHDIARCKTILREKEIEKK